MKKQVKPEVQEQKTYSQEEAQAIVQGFRDVSQKAPLAWGLVFLPEHFRDTVAKFQVQIMQAVMKYNELAVVAPRGHSKSTLLSFLYPIFCIYLKRKRYILIVGSTKEKSAEHIQAISKTIKENKILETIYGKMEINRDSAHLLEVEHSDGFATRIQAFGAEQLGKKRGTKFGAYRPDLIILDDVDDDELVLNADRRRELKHNIDNALFPMGDSKTQFIAVGTMLHFDCQIAKMVNKDQYTTWHKMFYVAVIDEAKKEVLWKECRNFDWLMEKKKNDPLTYAKEYQNNPVAGELTRFKHDNLLYWKEQGNGLVLMNHDNQPIKSISFKDCVPAIACDLAWSEKKTADFTAIMSGLLLPDGELAIYHYYNERSMRPERFSKLLLAQALHLHELTGTKPTIGFEKAMLERVHKHLLKQEMKRQQVFYVMKDLKWESDKITRIEVALEARYSNGTIYHRHGMGELEEQLLRFPYASHDDLLDAEQGLTQLLKYSKSSKHKVDDDQDDAFDWWRNNALPGRKKKNQPRVGTFLFGKNNHYTLPSKKTFGG